MFKKRMYQCKKVYFILKQSKRVFFELFSCLMLHKGGSAIKNTEIVYVCMIQIQIR